MALEGLHVYAIEEDGQLALLDAIPYGVQELEIPDGVRRIRVVWQQPAAEPLTSIPPSVVARLLRVKEMARRLSSDGLEPGSTLWVAIESLQAALDEVVDEPASTVITRYSNALAKIRAERPGHGA